MNKKEVLAVLGKLTDGDKGSSYGWIVDSYSRPRRPDLGDNVIAVLDRIKDSGYSWDRSPREYVWVDTDVDDPDYIAYDDDEETGEEVYTPYQAVIDRIMADYQGKSLVTIVIVMDGHDTDNPLGFLKLMPDDTGNEFDIIRVERSEDDTGQPAAKIIQDIESDVKERNVLLLTWAIGTGCTVDCVAAHLRERNARSVQVCAMLDDVALRTFDITVDYRVAELERKAVIGVAKGDGFHFPCLAI